MLWKTFEVRLNLYDAFMRKQKWDDYYCVRLGEGGFNPSCKRISDYSVTSAMYNYMKQRREVFIVLHKGEEQISYFTCIILSDSYSSKNKLKLLIFIFKGSKDLLQMIFLGFQNRNSNPSCLAKNNSKLPSYPPCIRTFRVKWYSEFLEW